MLGVYSLDAANLTAAEGAGAGAAALGAQQQRGTGEEGSCALAVGFPPPPVSPYADPQPESC